MNRGRLNADSKLSDNRHNGNNRNDSQQPAPYVKLTQENVPAFGTYAPPFLINAE
jgi:hypothetical protein